MKGIVLAGGTATRLFPVTSAISKQALPIYDKPMIYYPLSVLMLAGISEILIITTPRDLGIFKTMLGDGKAFGLSLSYAVQENPNGIAESFILGEAFIDGEACALVLGDNIYYGADIPKLCQSALQVKKGATIFAYQVSDPERYGVVSFDPVAKQAMSIEEKPKKPSSNWAVTGLYFYDNTVVDIAKSLRPSGRGELEITDINRTYLHSGTLHVATLGRGYAWLDTGTVESLYEASAFVQTIEKRQGFKIACLEEIAFNNGWITKEQVLESVAQFDNSPYGAYLKKCVEERR